MPRPGQEDRPVTRGQTLKAPRGLRAGAGPYQAGERDVGMADFAGRASPETAADAAGDHCPGQTVEPGARAQRRLRVTGRAAHRAAARSGVREGWRTQQRQSRTAPQAPWARAALTAARREICRRHARLVRLMKKAHPTPSWPLKFRPWLGKNTVRSTGQRLKHGQRCRRRCRRPERCTPCAPPDLQFGRKTDGVFAVRSPPACRPTCHRASNWTSSRARSGLPLVLSGTRAPLGGPPWRLAPAVRGFHFR